MHSQASEPYLHGTTQVILLLKVRQLKWAGDAPFFVSAVAGCYAPAAAKMILEEVNDFNMPVAVVTA